MYPFVSFSILLNNFARYVSNPTYHDKKIQLDLGLGAWHQRILRMISMCVCVHIYIYNYIILFILPRLVVDGRTSPALP